MVRANDPGIGRTGRDSALGVTRAIPPRKSFRAGVNWICGCPCSQVAGPECFCFSCLHSLLRGFRFSCRHSHHATANVLQRRSPYSSRSLPELPSSGANCADVAGQLPASSVLGRRNRRRHGQEVHASMVCRSQHRALRQRSLADGGADRHPFSVGESEGTDGTASGWTSAEAVAGRLEHRETRRHRADAAASRDSGAR